MTRLTVLYNLAPGSDEDEFLRWRLTEHQSANAGMPGVQHTDFGRIDAAWPEQKNAPYRFMTIVEWDTREEFEASFYDEEVQADLQKNLDKLADPVFLISEILTSSTTSEPSSEGAQA